MLTEVMPIGVVMNWFSRLRRAAYNAYCDVVADVACRLLRPLEDEIEE